MCILKLWLYSILDCFYRKDQYQAAAQAGQQDKQKPMPMHVEKKVGRNDPCPCGSGKKYKQCHGKGM